MKKILVVLSFLILAAIIALLVWEDYFAPARGNRTGGSFVSEGVISGKGEGNNSQRTDGNAQNISEGEAADHTAPVISGVKSFTIHTDESIDYLSHIVVSDDEDPQPFLTVDTSRVKTDAVGSYIVIYSASDASGNISYAAADVHVVSHDKISQAQADELAEDILSGLVTDDMTDFDKLEAVWNYLHDIGNTEVFYGDWDDILENAYHFLDTEEGNRRCFYAASKLLLENLGFETITVTNVEEAVIAHCWNLVSCDGGVTYYHFDPSCWSWGEDGDVLAVTDEWLWNYSARHEYRCYDWDSLAYPATPDHEFSD